MWEALRGNKTYVAAAGIAVLSFVFAMGWIDRGTYETLLGLLNGAALAALRAGTAKVEAKVETVSEKIP